MFDNKNILITGGTGSFGKKFVSTLLKRYSPKKIIIFSRDELKQYDMQNDVFFSKHSELLRYFIGDVRDYNRLKMSFEDVDFVVHAAALKQVPAAEYNPFEAVKTNIIGSQNVIDASIQTNVKKVIALSTDKAAAPSSLYGATKLTSDKLFIAANNYIGKNKLQFSVVRYGNVFGSRGSVVPLFLKLKNNGFLNITDIKMTRFNITLSEGVDFVIKCFNRMWGGEIFVPQIPSYRVKDVAMAISPNAKINIIGIRPGEKIHEEMITKSDSNLTAKFDDYFVIMPPMNTPKKPWEYDDFLKNSGEVEGKIMGYGFSYNSKENERFLTVNDIKNLIEDLNPY